MPQAVFRELKADVAFVAHRTRRTAVLAFVIAATSVALAIAFVASLALSLPISQPPNALAFATGQVTSRLILLYGTALSLMGLAIAMLELWVIRRFFSEF